MTCWCRGAQTQFASSRRWANRFTPQLLYPMWKSRQYPYVSDQVSHCYKRQAKLCFRIENWRAERFYIEWQQAFPDISLLLNSSWMELWFVRVISRYLNCSNVSNDLLPVCMLLFCFCFLNSCFDQCCWNLINIWWFVPFYVFNSHLKVKSIVLRH